MNHPTSIHESGVISPLSNQVEEEKTIEGLVNVLKDQIKFIHVFIIAFKQQVGSINFDSNIAEKMLASPN